MIRAELNGLRELKVHLGLVAPKVQTSLRIFVADQVLILRDTVKNNIARMFRSMGPLYQGVQAEMEEAPGSFTGLVWIDGKAIPYADIQERGGTTRAHDIKPKLPGGVLAFMSPAKMGFSSGDQANSLVFTKIVHHPGSRIPEHPYARLALFRQAPAFERGIRAIVLDAVEV